HKAGLWLTLENHTKAAVHFRNAPSELHTANGVVSELRSFVDTSKFSSPKVYFEAVGRISSGGSAQISLVSSGNESGSGGQSDVASSTISMNSEDKVLSRTVSDVSWTAGQKLMTKV